MMKSYIKHAALTVLVIACLSYAAKKSDTIRQITSSETGIIDSAIEASKGFFSRTWDKITGIFD